MHGNRPGDQLSNSLKFVCFWQLVSQHFCLPRALWCIPKAADSPGDVFCKLKAAGAASLEWRVCEGRVASQLTVNGGFFA